jgi:hypothetical protein
VNGDGCSSLSEAFSDGGPKAGSSTRDEGYFIVEAKGIEDIRHGF